MFRGKLSSTIKNYGCNVESNEFTINSTIDGRNARLLMTSKTMKYCDVCIVGSKIDSANFIDKVKQLNRPGASSDILKL